MNMLHLRMGKKRSTTITIKTTVCTVGIHQNRFPIQAVEMEITVPLRDQFSRAVLNYWSEHGTAYYYPAGCMQQLLFLAYTFSIKHKILRDAVIFIFVISPCSHHLPVSQIHIVNFRNKLAEKFAIKYKPTFQVC